MRPKGVSLVVSNKRPHVKANQDASLNQQRQIAIAKTPSFVRTVVGESTPSDSVVGQEEGSIVQKFLAPSAGLPRRCGGRNKSRATTIGTRLSSYHS